MNPMKSPLSKVNSTEIFFANNTFHKGTGGSWGKERSPLYPDKDDFYTRLKSVVDKTGLKISENLYFSLCYCIISKSHLLVDATPLEKQG
jgi:hypothetical protein